MPLLVATPGDPAANSYIDVAAADEILATRLYTDAWDAAASTPDAEGFVVDGDHDIGDSNIAVTPGTGSFTVGSRVRFAGFSQVYTVTATPPGHSTVSPNLVDDIPDGTEIIRLTASTKEKALIWATSVLDSLIDWYGYVLDTDQVLRWPRRDVYDREGFQLDPLTIPYDIEVATAELALALLTKDRAAEPGILGQGIEEAAVGTLRVKVSKQQVEEVVPKHVLALIAHLGTLSQSAQTGSMKIVRLERA